jgi:hypothetical protein
MNFTFNLLTVHLLQHTSTVNNSATGSFANKTGGVHLPASMTSTAMTAGSGNVTAASAGGTGAGSYNGAASSVAPSSRYSSTTTGNEAPPTYTLRETGWIAIPNVGYTNLPCFSTRLTHVFQQWREEPVPELADDDVETFNDDSEGEDFDM